jgi:hypothetical protein
MCKQARARARATLARARARARVTTRVTTSNVLLSWSATVCLH